jgi:iron(III) transport system permease protein
VAEEVGGTLRIGLQRWEQTLLLGAAGAILGVVALLPLVQLFAQLFTSGTSAFSVLGTGRPWALLSYSIGLSAAVTLCALAIGTPLGVLIARMDLPGRRILWLLHAFPMFLPPFVLVLGWFHLAGRPGFLGNETTASLLFSPLGMIAVLSLAFAPVVTSLVALAIMGIDASLEEAARLVASPWRVVTRILLPAARPALVLSAIIVFALSLSELGVPMFLRVDVFPAAVFARLGGIAYAPGEAFVLVLPLVPIALFLLFIERRFVGVRSFAVAGLRGMSRSPLPLGRWRPAATVVCWSLAVLSIAPMAVLAVRAALGRGFTQLPQWLGQAPWTSLISAVVAATVIAALALVLGHAAARRLLGATSLDALAMLVFVLPASVLGVGLIAVWNRPTTGALYGSMAILVIGYVARYSIVGVRTVASVVLQSSVHLEEAASASGAGFARRLFLIVLPVNARGIAFAWLLALVFCLRDLESAVLFYPPGGEPLTVRLFTLEANGPTAVVAALAVTQVAMTAAALALGALLLPKGRYA